jgi:hypothetical protein
MGMFLQRLLLWALLGLVCFSPVLIGALPAFPTALAEGALTVFVAYAFGHARSPRLKQVTLIPLSTCFAVTLFDLSARPLLFQLFEVRPTERFIHRWPPLPLLQRYAPGVTYEGMTYGDLAAVSGRRDWREERLVKFVTDAYGFRNEPSGAVGEERPLDVIVLGDSFGVAGGTTQEETLSSLLARDYGMRVYNLSVSRENPQQQYANLLLEGPRLRTRPGTCVLWLIFAGNDLDEPYYAALENPRPAPPGLRRRLVTGFHDFRARSPVRRLWSTRGTELVIAREFLDGRPVLFSAPYAERKGRAAEQVRSHPNFEGLKATLDAMKRLTVARRLKVAVALVPGKEEVYSWALDGAPPWSTNRAPSGFSVEMRELCARHGFPYLDLKPALVEESERVFQESGGLLWWRDDTHWNAAGQRVSAAIIHEMLLGP